MPITRDEVTRADGIGGRKHLDKVWNGDFDAPLKTDFHPVRGQGVPTFTRTTAGWYFNESGNLVEVPSGSARFTGARMVYNFIPQSENLSTGWTRRGACTVTGGQTDPRGGTTAYRINDVATAGVNDIYYSVSYPSIKSTRRLYIGFWIKRVSVTGVVRFSNPDGQASGYATINLASIPDGWVYVDINSPYVTIINQFISSPSTNVCGILFSENVSTTISFMVWGITSATLESIDQSNAANEYVSRGVLSGFFHGAGADGVKFFDTDNGGAKIKSDVLKGVLIEGTKTNSLRQNRNLALPATATTSGVKAWYTDPTGPELLTNGDFGGGLSNWTNVSTGSGTATLSAGGVALSGTTSGNRGAIEQVVTGLDPSKWYVMQIDVTSFTSGSITMGIGATSGMGDFEDYYVFTTSAGTHRRMIQVPAATSYVKVWTAGGGGVGTVDNISFKLSSLGPTFGETGIDGVPNTCTTLNAVVDGGSIYQNYVAAATGKTFSVYIKRKTGSGTVSLTRDGGTSWTDVTNQITSDKFTRVAIRFTSVTDPTCGVKLGSAGDEIIVDCAQDETSESETSPILTTTVTVSRNSDLMSYSSVNVNATTNTIYAEGTPSQDADYDRRIVGVTAPNNNRAIIYYQNGHTVYGDGAALVETGQIQYPYGSSVRVMAKWVNGSSGNYFCNGVKATPTAGNVDVTPTTVDIGYASSSNRVFTGSIKNVKIFRRLLTDEQCINATLLGAD